MLNSLNESPWTTHCHHRSRSTLLIYLLVNGEVGSRHKRGGQPQRMQTNIPNPHSSSTNWLPWLVRKPSPARQLLIILTSGLSSTIITLSKGLCLARDVNSLATIQSAGRRKNWRQEVVPGPTTNPSLSKRRGRASEQGGKQNRRQPKKCPQIWSRALPGTLQHVHKDVCDTPNSVRLESI